MKIGKELMKGSTVTVILKLLSEQNMYGYQITQELKSRSDRLLDMKEGTLYPMLHTLEKDGAVDSYWLDSSEGRRRKYYRITDKGRHILKEKQKEWKLFTEMVGGIILGGEGYDYV